MGDEMEVLGDLAGDREGVDTLLAVQGLFVAAVGLEPLSLLERCLHFSKSVKHLSVNLTGAIRRTSA